MILKRYQEGKKKVHGKQRIKTMNKNNGKPRTGQMKCKQRPGEVYASRGRESRIFVSFRAVRALH